MSGKEGAGNPEASRARLDPLPPLDALEREWLELQGRSDHSFFISWWWIGPWLERLPREVRPMLLRVHRGERLIALGVACPRRVRRRHVVVSNAVYLNSTGDPRYDELTVQYNGLLVERGAEEEALRASLGLLLGEAGWDEVFIDGFHAPASVHAIAPAGIIPAVERTTPGYRVDLDELRRSGKPHLERLSSRSRSNVRRSFKEAEKHGELRFEVAKDADEAVAFLTELKALHQATWTARGEPGSFANALFDAFHFDFVRRNVPTGRVEMMRMRVGERGVGYLYSFIHEARVYVYQSAFDLQFSSQPNWRPGIVCHVGAIDRYLAGGMSVYDFLAGDYRYKRELATGTAEMGWVVFQRPRVKFRAEACVRRLKRRWRQWLERRKTVARSAPAEYQARDPAP